MMDFNFRFGAPTSQGKVPFTIPETDRQCETAYWVWGDPTSTSPPPLIVLHGGPGAPGRDLMALARLYERYGIPSVHYDQIGCGLSTHFPHHKHNTSFWTISLFISELQNLLSHLKVEQYDLLGQSWGGMLAAELDISARQGHVRSPAVTEESPAHGWGSCESHVSSPHDYSLAVQAAISAFRSSTLPGPM